VYEYVDGATHLASTGPRDYDAYFGTVSHDGRRLLFTTAESLVQGDRDRFDDLYQHTGRTTTFVSRREDGVSDAGPAYRWLASFNRMASPLISADGGRIVFTTEKRLVPSDRNGLPDVYERSHGRTRLLSRQPGGRLP
jgi:Tol biopolymer transport system component